MKVCLCLLFLLLSTFAGAAPEEVADRTAEARRQILLGRISTPSQAFLDRLYQYQESTWPGSQVGLRTLIWARRYEELEKKFSKRSETLLFIRAKQAREAKDNERVRQLFQEHNKLRLRKNTEPWKRLEWSFYQSLDDPEVWKEGNLVSDTPPGTRYRTFFPPIDTDGLRYSQNPLRFDRNLLKAPLAWYQSFTKFARRGGLERAEAYRTLGDIGNWTGDLELAWYGYRYALEYQHPASQDLQRALQEVEATFEETNTYRRPTEETFQQVLKASERWQDEYTKAEKELLKTLDPSTALTTIESSSRERANEASPAISTTAYTLPNPRTHLLIFAGILLLIVALRVRSFRAKI